MEVYDAATHEDRVRLDMIANLIDLLDEALNAALRDMPGVTKPFLEECFAQEIAKRSQARQIALGTFVGWLQTCEDEALARQTQAPSFRMHILDLSQAQSIIQDMEEPNDA